MSKTQKDNLPQCLQNRLNESDKSAYQQYYTEGSTKAIRKLLIEELKARIDQLTVESENKERFDIPAWTEYQASNIGTRRAMRILIR